MKAGEVTVTYTLKGGVSSTQYYWGIESDSPDVCTFISKGGSSYFTAKTDSSGQLRETVVIPEAVGRNDFWIYSVTSIGVGYNRSAVAHV